MTIFSQIPETAARFTIIGPDTTRAVLNDDTDADYVGTFGEEGITGLDDAEIRENAWDLVEADGGVHGNFWLGRRPVTLTIDVLADSQQQRSARLERIKRATNALRADGTLVWNPTNPAVPTQFLTFRRQQPRRITGNWKKTIFLALVAADPRIYSGAIYSEDILQSQGFVAITNQGDYLSPPSLRVHGPFTDATISNGTLEINLNVTLTTGQFIDIDLVQRTVTDQTGASRFGVVDFLNTAWWQLAPGQNNIKVDWGSGAEAGVSKLTITWRDAWA
jgi:hypothetical protein